MYFSPVYNESGRTRTQKEGHYFIEYFYIDLLNECLSYADEAPPRDPLQPHEAAADGDAKEVRGCVVPHAARPAPRHNRWVQRVQANKAP